MPARKLPFKEFKWTPEMAYAVGLLTTDGSLSKDGRHVAFRSSDKQQTENFKKCLKISNSISKTYADQCKDRPSYLIQFGNIQLYNWFLSIGLFPAKTYTIGKIKIPDEYFRDFLRGHIDGDGSIWTYQDK
ncbi:MAG: LAGLIDADG family homing endonuclease [Patescibacteria group bacterium]